MIITRGTDLWWRKAKLALGHLQRAEKYFVYFIYMFLIHACFQLEPTFPTTPFFTTFWTFSIQGYRYHKLRKTFSKFYRRHYELVSKFNVGLKTLLHQGLSEPEFYGDLIYKFKKNVGRADFSDQFRKIIVRYKRIGYNINIMRHLHA